MQLLLPMQAQEPSNFNLSHSADMKQAVVVGMCVPASQPRTPSPCNQEYAAAQHPATARQAPAARARAAHMAAGIRGAPDHTWPAQCCCKEEDGIQSGRKKAGLLLSTQIQRAMSALWASLCLRSHRGMGLGSQNSQEMRSFRLVASSSSLCTDTQQKGQNRTRLADPPTQELAYNSSAFGKSAGTDGAARPAAQVVSRNVQSLRQLTSAMSLEKSPGMRLLVTLMTPCKERPQQLCPDSSKCRYACEWTQLFSPAHDA